MRGLSDGTYSASGERYPRWREGGGPQCECPTCGQMMPRAKVTLQTLVDIDLGPREARIVERLVESYPSKVTSDDLIRAGWDNAPAQTVRGLRVIMNNLRSKLFEYGWTIPLAKTGPGSQGYRLKLLKP